MGQGKITVELCSPQLPTTMIELAKDAATTDVTHLLTRYSFDLNGYTVDRLVSNWFSRYPVQWIRLAVIEALYQGRYKAISVEQILNLWQRRGKSLYRFSHEFERIICGRFPYSSTAHSTVRPVVRSQPVVSPPAKPVALPVEPPPHSEPSWARPVALPDEQEPIAEPALPIPESHSPEPVDAASEYAASDYAALPEPPEADEDLDSTFRPIQGVPVPTFKPVLMEELERLSIPQPAKVAVGSQAGSQSSHQPIHQFIPTPEPSDFYSKLRAVALGVAEREPVDDAHLAPTENLHSES